MILTESQARDRHCPHTLVGCDASDCMMWRWAEPVRLRFTMAPDEFNTIGENDPEPPRPSHVPASWTWCPCVEDPAGWVEPNESAMARRCGFCGLAGKPEDFA